MSTEPRFTLGDNIEHFNIGELAEQNPDFRRVVWTGKHSQIVIVMIPVGGEIGDEVHENIRIRYSPSLAAPEKPTWQSVHTRLRLATSVPCRQELGIIFATPATRISCFIRFIVRRNMHPAPSIRPRKTAMLRRRPGRMSLQLCEHGVSSRSTTAPEFIEETLM